MGIPDELTLKLNAETQKRIHEINRILDRGIEIGPETRETIEALIETLKNGIEVGFKPATLDKIDELLQTIEKGLKIGLDDDTLARVDDLLDSLDKAPDKWKETITAIIELLADRTGTIVEEIAAEIRDVMEEAKRSTEEIVAITGIEARCNVQFANDTVNEFMGHSLAERLRALIFGTELEAPEAIPWVCQILPDQITLEQSGDRLVPKDEVIRITGYDFRDSNLPVVSLLDSVENQTEFERQPQRTSDYMVQLNVQGYDFTNVPEGSYLEFQWANLDKPSSISIVLPKPEASEPELTILVDTNVYVGPGREYRILGQADKDATYPVAFRTTDSKWWQIEYGEEDGWVSNDDVERNEVPVDVTRYPPPPAPVADFVYEPIDGRAPVTVRFHDQSTGDGLDYIWGFGDGSISDERSPGHSYSEAGEFTVKLTVTNKWGESSRTQKVMVNEPLPPAPVAAFGAISVSGRSPLTVQFQDLSTGNPTSWEWDFGDGSDSSHDRNPSHTYIHYEAVTKSYAVTLRVTNESGAEDTIHKEDFVHVSMMSFEPESIQFFTIRPDQIDQPLTDYPLDHYVCGIVGMKADNGDIEAKKTGPILVVKMYGKEVGGTRYWTPYADFLTENKEKWTLDVMCLNKDMSPPRATGPEYLGGWIYQEYYNTPSGTVYTDIPTPRYDDDGILIKGFDCGIVGLQSTAGDINEKDDGDILIARANQDHGFWALRVDFHSHENHHEEWRTVNVLCFASTLVDEAGQPYFMVKRYNSQGDNVAKHTQPPILASDYACGIVGMYAENGNINEDGLGRILIANMYPQNNRWYLRADFRTEDNHEDWAIDTLCVRKPIAHEERTNWIK